MRACHYLRPLLFSLLLLPFLLSTGSAQDHPDWPPRLDPTRTTLHPEWKRFFDTLGLDSGCIVIYDEQANRYHVYNPARAERGYAPVSLFKVVLTLEALEEKLIDSSNTLIKWDGLNRGSSELNQNHTILEAFHNVSIWAFTQLSARIGKERLYEVMSRIRYGNADTAGDAVRFWTNGRLKISSVASSDFIRMVADGRVPGYSQRSQRIVRDMLFRIDTLGTALYRKTGLGWVGDVQLGRNQGWVERNGRRWFFCLNFQTTDMAFPTRAARRYIFVSALQSVGALPNGWDAD